MNRQSRFLDGLMQDPAQIGANGIGERDVSDDAVTKEGVMLSATRAVKKTDPAGRCHAACIVPAGYRRRSPKSANAR